MALEATHIRFALDNAAIHNVQDIPKYIVGTLYPDSRYKTGIARELTHPADFLTWDLTTKDDFTKGWYMHLLCDKVQGAIFKKLFPEIFAHGEITAASEPWIHLTAVKVLQDLHDAHNFDVSHNLPDPALCEPHNNESMEDLIAFYNIIRSAYIDLSALTLQTYARKLHALGLPENLAQKVVEVAEEYNKDAESRQKISTIYLEMVKFEKSNI